MAKIPEKLLKLRKGHNLSQDYLAKKLGIDIFDYMAIENGRESIDKITIDKIANLYEITSEELINEKEDVRIINLGNKFKEEKRKFEIHNFLNNLKHGKYNTHVFVGVTITFFLIAVIAFLPKTYNISVTMNPKVSDTLSANRDTVVFLNDSPISKGKDNISFGDDKVVKVVSGINYFAALTEDGRLKTSGFNVNYKKEVDSIKNAVDIASGQSHILVLLNNGKVKCIGNNDYGQCEVNKWEKVTKIYADSYGSVAVSENGLLYTGNIPYVEKLLELSFKQIEFDDDNLFVLLDNGEVKIFGNTKFNLEDFNDLVEIASDKSFIAGLKKDGTVVIDIDNYLLKEKVKFFEGIKTIDAGESYLVLSDGYKVYGLGDNKYNQFEELEIVLEPLDAISNLKIEKVEDEVIITFDEVLNANAYTLVIDEINVDIKVTENKFVLPLSSFEPNVKYILMITANDTFGLYLDSETRHAVFTYSENVKKEEPETSKEEIVLEIPFVFKDFVGLKEEDLLSFLNAYGYDLAKLKKESVNECESTDSILSIEGIVAGEEITTTKLKEREISYKYCEVEAN